MKHTAIYNLQFMAQFAKVGTQCFIWTHLSTH